MYLNISLRITHWPCKISILFVKYMWRLFAQRKKFVVEFSDTLIGTHRKIIVFLFGPVFSFSGERFGVCSFLFFFFFFFSVPWDTFGTNGHTNYVESFVLYKSFLHLENTSSRNKGNFQKTKLIYTGYLVSHGTYKERTIHTSKKTL